VKSEPWTDYGGFLLKALTPHEQFAREIRICLNRWNQESDIPPLDLAEIAAGVFNEWMDEPVVTFEPDVLRGGEDGDDDPYIDWEGDDDDSEEIL